MMHFPAEFSFLNPPEILLPDAHLCSFPISTGVSGAPKLTWPRPQPHLGFSAGFKEQEDHVCHCKVLVF